MSIFYQNISKPHYIDLKSKETLVTDYVDKMLSRTARMFEYKNLPDSIPQKTLEIMLQTTGYTCIISHEKNLYAVYAGVGGMPNEYYQPTLAIVSNPYLHITGANYKINEDCVIIPSDSFYQGLMVINNKYASLIADAEITLRTNLINARIPNILLANTDKAKKDAEIFLSKVEEGNIGAMAGNALIESLTSVPVLQSTASYLTDIIESIQYLKASWYNELGLNANYNMKRESINSVEAQINNDGLLPLPQDMLLCRKEALEKINEIFGTKITVELSGVWAEKTQEEEIKNEKGLKFETYETEEETLDETE